MLYLDPTYPNTATTQKSFLSWQSEYWTTITLILVHMYSTAWDLLRIDVYGFAGFCEWF